MGGQTTHVLFQPDPIQEFARKLVNLELPPRAANLKAQFLEEGFLIVPELLSSEIVKQLVQAIERVMDHRGVQSRHALRHLIQAVPLVGHVADSSPVRELVELFLGPKAVVVRGLLFDKSPEANWKVAWHQDLTIAVRERIEVPGFSSWSIKEGVPHVQPPVDILERMLTVRLHLDDCDFANGPVQVIPGSEKAGRLNAGQIAHWRATNEPMTCAVPSGGALLMRPLLLHASSAARKPGHRRVVHLEFAEESLPGGLQWFGPEALSGE